MAASARQTLDRARMAAFVRACGHAGGDFESLDDTTADDSTWHPGVEENEQDLGLVRDAMAAAGAPVTANPSSPSASYGSCSSDGDDSVSRGTDSPVTTYDGTLTDDEQQPPPVGAPGHAGVSGDFVAPVILPAVAPVPFGPPAPTPPASAPAPGPASAPAPGSASAPATPAAEAEAEARPHRYNTRYARRTYGA